MDVWGRTLSHMPFYNNLFVKVLLCSWELRKRIFHSPWAEKVTKNLQERTTCLPCLTEIVPHLSQGKDGIVRSSTFSPFLTGKYDLQSQDKVGTFSYATCLVPFSQCQQVIRKSLGWHPLAFYFLGSEPPAQAASTSVIICSISKISGKIKFLIDQSW